MNNYAILIGINEYHESLGNLKYAGADCRRLKKVLLSGSLGFEEERILLLDDTQEDERKPTFANIYTWLSSWLAQPKKDDLVLFYYAGHGRDMDNKSYLVPGDATLSTLHTLGIPLTNIQELMGRCKARNKILIIDACHIGAGRDVAPMSINWQDNLSQSKGIYTVTSCGVDELSHEWAEKSQGVFSWFLSEALSGHCPPNADGKLTIERIYEWVYEKVTIWAANHRCKQTPQRFSQGSGVITLAETEPDYKAMMEQMQQELVTARKKITELRDKEEDGSYRWKRQEKKQFQALQNENDRLQRELTLAQRKLDKFLEQSAELKKELNKTKSQLIRQRMNKIWPYATVVLVVLIIAVSVVWYSGFQEKRRLPLAEKLYSDMLAEYKVSDYARAYTLGREVISKIDNLNSKKEKALYTQVRTTFDSEIAPAYYAMEKFWAEGNKLYRWNEKAKRAVFIAEFNNRIDDFKVSPDQKRVAVLSNHYCYIVNIDGSHLVELKYGADTINGWVDNDSIEFEGYSGFDSGTTFKGKMIWNDGVFKINENNSPISFTKTKS